MLPYVLRIFFVPKLSLVNLAYGHGHRLLLKTIETLVPLVVKNRD